RGPDAPRPGGTPRRLPLGRGLCVPAALPRGGPALLGGGTARASPRLRPAVGRGRAAAAATAALLGVAEPAVLVPGAVPRGAAPAVGAGWPWAASRAGRAALVWHAWRTGRLRGPLRLCPPRAVLAGLLAVVLAAKLVFVATVVPARARGREPRAKGERLAALVPPGRSLYLLGAKDEGILFYYGRPARRLAGPQALPGAHG